MEIPFLEGSMHVRFNFNFWTFRQNIVFELNLCSSLRTNKKDPALKILIGCPPDALYLIVGQDSQSSIC